MTKKSHSEKQKIVVRIFCIALAVLLVSSTLFAALGIFAL